MAQLNSFLPEPIDEKDEEERLYLLQRRYNILERCGLIEMLQLMFKQKQKNYKIKHEIKNISLKRDVQERYALNVVKNNVIGESPIILRRSSRLRKKYICGNDENTKLCEKLECLLSPRDSKDRLIIKKNKEVNKQQFL